MDLCNWADVVYGCDPAWWKHRRGLPEFKGLKVAWAGAALAGYPDIKTVELVAVKTALGKTYSDEISLVPGTIGAGGNSGYQALNLALQFGARRIILIGFDMDDRRGVHWYGRNNWPMANNPDQTNFRRWITGFERAAPVIAALGAEVVNASPASALHCFPRRSIEQALSEWA